MDSEHCRHPTYLAYMLRLWQTGSRSGRPVWRGSLENPHTGERLAFSDPQTLLDFLANLTPFSPAVNCEAETAEAALLDDSTSLPPGGDDPGDTRAEDNGNAADCSLLNS